MQATFRQVFGNDAAKWLLIIGLSILVAVEGLWFLGSGLGYPKSDKRVAAPGKHYQAVFLTNGQVYFGKTQNDAADPIVLRDVYYLQVTQQLQPAPEPGQSPQSVPQISLVKLGNELHKPTDEMRITRSQVLFVEDLKGDSPVVQAITNRARQ